MRRDGRRRGGHCCTASMTGRTALRCRPITIRALDALARPGHLAPGCDRRRDYRLKSRPRMMRCRVHTTPRDATSDQCDSAVSSMRALDDAVSSDAPTRI